MTEYMDIIQDLRELRELYRTGDLRDWDFESKIFHYQRTVERFEADMETQIASWSFMQEATHEQPR
jgi:hypothetical protein